jgi:ribosomal protein L14
MMTTTRTDLGVMSGKMTYKTVTSNKEQVHIIIRETGESIKSIAIHRHEHWSREHGMLIEFHPVGVVVIGRVVGSGHGVLN